jgi:hypothetical protein
VKPVTHERELEGFKPSVQQVVSEILHIVRPVLYTMAKAATSRKPDSWTPFFLSMAVDAASRALAPSLTSLAPDEFKEVITRMRRYAFYLLREPFFNKFMTSERTKQQQTQQVPGRAPLACTHSTFLLHPFISHPARFLVLLFPIFSYLSLSGPLLRLSGLLLRIPLIGGFFASMIHLLFAVQKVYFYTAAS